MADEKTITQIQHVFLCPVHGEEGELLCFEAFQPENITRWRKLEVTSHLVDFPEDERKLFFEALISRRTSK
jgi:hypothetical protein